MTPVFLWIDALVWLQVVMLGGFWWHIRRREHLARPWRVALADPVARVSLTVLLAYVAVGLLDSVHFLSAGGGSTEGNEPWSALDGLLDSLRRRDEKTYSAPLAWHGHSRETLGVDPALRGYPRLAFGGAHLSSPEQDWVGDILRRGVYGLVGGLGAWLVGLGFVRWRCSKHAGCAVTWTMLGLCLCVGLIAGWSVDYHPLGTDKIGQDVLYQNLKSVRTGLVIGTLTTLITLPLALFFGIVAGYFRGLVDDAIQYLYTTLNSIPGVLLIAATILITQVIMARHEDAFASLAARADLRLVSLCAILGLTSWTGLCRLLRAETLKLRGMEFVQAAQALGVSDGRILLRHILPNVFHLVLISVALDFSSLVLAEAVLSYISIGVDPATHSWGNMINSARLELARDPVVWWPLVSALVFMFTLVLAANLFADALRDAFDPRRGSGA